MNTFKTKYKSCLSATEEYQYIKQKDDAPSTFKENVPRQKQSNYKASLVKAVSSGKNLYIQQDQLTGKGVNTKEKIYNEIETKNNGREDAHCPLGKLDDWSSRRIMKKNNIIYDLLN
mgnify:FL=1